MHYYSSSTTALSPFTHSFSYWDLTKPTVVAEFHMTTTDGIPDNSLFQVLYQNGYAGALVWSWSDFPVTPNNPNAANDTWAVLHAMKANYKQYIDPFNTDYPVITIINPLDKSTFQDITELTVSSAVMDTGSIINYVKIYSNDSLLGTIVNPSQISSDTLYYNFDLKNINSGNYVLTALAENNKGQHEISMPVQISVGTAKVSKLEAEKASINGPGITTQQDPTASGGAYYDIKTNDTTITITWQFKNVLTSGDYPISFGYKLFYDTPKSQFININGVRADTITFVGSKSSWLEKTITVHLEQGTNTVQMQLWWGWMYLDYLAVPSSIVTGVVDKKEIPIVFSLSQNFPNPFNPSTEIRFTIPKFTEVNLTVYNILGEVVESLINKDLTAGTYNIKFDGSKYSSGVYFYTLRTEDKMLTKKMILLK